MFYAFFFPGSGTCTSTMARNMIAQPSISRHLDVLKKAELVTSERRGNQIFYSLNMSAAQEMLLYITELLSPRMDQEVSRECP